MARCAPGSDSSILREPYTFCVERNAASPGESWGFLFCGSFHGVEILENRRSDIISRFIGVVCLVCRWLVGCLADDVGGQILDMRGLNLLIYY